MPPASTLGTVPKNHTASHGGIKGKWETTVSPPHPYHVSTTGLGHLGRAQWAEVSACTPCHISARCWWQGRQVRWRAHMVSMWVTPLIIQQQHRTDQVQWDLQHSSSKCFLSQQTPWLFTSKSKHLERDHFTGFHSTAQLLPLQLDCSASPRQAGKCRTHGHPWDHHPGTQQSNGQP